jgi:hypothetical protein
MLIKNKGMVKIFSQIFSDQNVFLLFDIYSIVLSKEIIFLYYTKKFDNNQPLARFHEKLSLKVLYFLYITRV